MKFEIHWLEHHDCADEKEEQEYLDCLPPKTEITGCLCGATEFECADTFEANSLKELYNIVNEYDIPIDVFTVFDLQGNKLFTEKDLEQLEKELML